MNRSGLLNQYLSVGSYLVHEYQDAANLDTTDPSKSASDRLRKAQESLRIFEEHSIHPIFGPLVEATADKLWGIDTSKRHAGTITGPDQRVAGIISTVAEDVAREENVDPQTVEDMIYLVTMGGDAQLIRTFLHNYNAPDYLRRALNRVLDKTVSDRDITAEKISNIWLVELYRRAFGSSLELGYQLNGFPTTDKFETGIVDFLRKPELVLEIYQRIREEAPDVFHKAIRMLPPELVRKLNNQGIDNLSELSGIDEIDYDAVLAEINQRTQATDRLPTAEELDAQDRSMTAEWQKLMPCSADSGQSATAANLTFIHRPTKIGASRRAFTMKYKSGGRDNHHDVNDILITPYDGGERAWQLRAHEDTHKAHNTGLARKEQHGDIPEGSELSVTHGVREMLAVFVDNAAQRYWRHKYMTPVQPGKYANLKIGVTLRAQGPYCLAQLLTRRTINGYLDQGVNVPDPDTIGKIIDDVTHRLQEAFGFGVNLNQNRMQLAINLWELGMYDGANYILDDLAPQAATIPPVRQAFEDQFGVDWLWSPKADEARAILLFLYGETGHHPQGTPEDMKALANIVRTKDPQEARRQLIEMGYQEQYI